MSIEMENRRSTMSRLAKSALIAVTLLASAGPAAASESPGMRAANVVGHWIAMQGNQALRDIKQELRDRLAESLKPILPAPTAAAPAPTPATKR